MEGAAAEAEHPGYCGCSDFDARYPDSRVVYEIAGRRAAQPGIEVGRDFHVRQFVSVDGSADRPADELRYEPGVGRSARRAGDVPIHGPKGNSNPARGRQT